MKFQIILKNGVQFDVNVSKFVINRDPIHGNIQEITWAGTDAGQQLTYIDLSQIVAITSYAEGGEGESND
jgi:hypothetical protein